jgi:hypothetical protein
MSHENWGYKIYNDEKIDEELRERQLKYIDSPLDIVLNKLVGHIPNMNKYKGEFTIIQNGVSGIFFHKEQYKHIDFRTALIRPYGFIVFLNR